MRQGNQAQTPNPAQGNGLKKPYVPPQLQTLGTISEMTKQNTGVPIDGNTNNPGSNA